MWAGVVIATPGGYFRATSTFFVNLLPFFFLFFTFFQIENLYIETVILLIILFYPLLCSSSSLSYWDFWRISEERKMNQGFLPHCRVLGSAAGNTLYYRGRCRPFPLATPPLHKAISTIMFNLKSLFSCVVIHTHIHTHTHTHTHTLCPQKCVSEANICGDSCALFLRLSSLVKIILQKKPFDISWVHLNCMLQNLQMVYLGHLVCPDAKHICQLKSLWWFLQNEVFLNVFKIGKLLSWLTSSWKREKDTLKVKTTEWLENLVSRA